MSIRLLMIYVPYSFSILRILSDVYTKKKSWRCVHLKIDIDVSSFYKNMCTRRQKICAFLGPLQRPTLVRKVIDVYTKKKSSRYGFWHFLSDVYTKNNVFHSTRHYDIYVFFIKKKFENFVRCVHQKKKLAMCTYVFWLSMCTLKIVKIDDTSICDFRDTFKVPLVQNVIDVYINFIFVRYGFWHIFSSSHENFSRCVHQFFRKSFLH